MQKNEKILTLVLAVLLVIFALVALYLNVLMPKGGQSSTTLINQIDKPVKLNNTLKTSVTVLPAPDNAVPQK